MKKLDLQSQEHKAEKEKFWNITISLVISALVLGILGISYIRTNPDKFYPVKKSVISKKDAERWYNAVAEGNEKEAILSAAKIIPDDDPSLPNTDFIQFLINNGLGTLILTSPFNHFDYLRWKDAYEIKKIVNLYDEKGEIIPELFKEVMKRQKKVHDSEPLSLKDMFYDQKTIANVRPNTSVIYIWENGYNSFDEIKRLFAALSYQAGYEIQIVCFYDDSLKLKYEVCEIRKKGKSYVADFIQGRIYSDITVSEMVKDSKLSHNNEIKLNLPRVYNLPAEALDYKLYNAKLYEKLKGMGMHDIPLFGQNPQSRIDKYIENYSNKSEYNHYTYWNFPFKSLMFSPSFPRDWRLPRKAGVKSESGK